MNAPTYGDPENLEAYIAAYEIEERNRFYTGHYRQAQQLLRANDISSARQLLLRLWADLPLFGDPANLAARVGIDYQSIEKREKDIRFLRDPVPRGLATKPGYLWWSTFFLLLGEGALFGLATASLLWAGGACLVVILLLSILDPYRIINPKVTRRVYLISIIFACGIGWFGSQIRLFLLTQVQFVLNGTSWQEINLHLGPFILALATLLVTGLLVLFWFFGLVHLWSLRRRYYRYLSNNGRIKEQDW